jgi:MoaA/NifB/PqqE/SkfB family radical SAM enzyme
MKDMSQSIVKTTEGVPAARNLWAFALRNARLILRGAYEYNIAHRFGALPAREWLFPVTYHCNARCVMCNIWQSQRSTELSLDQWNSILDDRLFAGIESVSLTGGEPTMRQDLPELTGLLLARLPSLRRVTITTNALQPKRVVQHCQQLLKLCRSHGASFFVGLSLDGIGTVHDEMRNVPHAFAQVESTVEQLNALQPHGLRMGINCTLTSRNLHDAYNVQQWATERGLPVNYIIASFADSFYANVDSRDDLAFGTEHRKQLARFLQTLAADRSVGNLPAYFYNDALRMIDTGAARSTPCVFQKDGFILDARGDMQYCMYSQVLGNVTETSAAEIYYASRNLAHRQSIIDTKCRNCTITCFLELALAKDALRYARFLLGGKP